jgi:hypothetical protein
LLSGTRRARGRGTRCSSVNARPATTCMSMEIVPISPGGGAAASGDLGPDVRQHLAGRPSRGAGSYWSRGSARTTAGIRNAGGVPAQMLSSLVRLVTWSLSDVTCEIIDVICLPPVRAPVARRAGACYSERARPRAANDPPPQSAKFSNSGVWVSGARPPADQYIPPMPPPAPAMVGFSSFFSTTTHSVVRSKPAIDAAFCSAVRATLVGSMTPAFTRSS